MQRGHDFVKKNSVTRCLPFSSVGSATHLLQLVQRRKQIRLQDTRQYGDRHKNLTPPFGIASNLIGIKDDLKPLRDQQKLFKIGVLWTGSTSNPFIDGLGRSSFLHP